MRGLVMTLPCVAMGLNRASRSLARSLRGTRSFRGGALSAAAAPTAAAADAQLFIDGVNVEYENLHRAFEAQFWGTKMALSSKHARTAGALLCIATRGRLRKKALDRSKKKARRDAPCVCVWPLSRVMRERAKDDVMSRCRCRPVRVRASTRWRS